MDWKKIITNEKGFKSFYITKRKPFVYVWCWRRGMDDEHKMSKNFTKEKLSFFENNQLRCLPTN